MQIVRVFVNVAPPCHVQDRLSSIGTIPAVTHAILPPFKMNKTLKNVEELWREYTVGLGGHPSTRQMYEFRGLQGCLGWGVLVLFAPNP